MSNNTDNTTHFGYKDVPTEEKQAMVADVFHSVAAKYEIRWLPDLLAKKSEIDWNIFRLGSWMTDKLRKLFGIWGFKKANDFCNFSLIRSKFFVEINVKQMDSQIH